MQDWFTPQGIETIALVITAALGLLGTVLNWLGKRDKAEKVLSLQGHATKAATTIGVVVGGIERARKTGKLDPETARELVETIRGLSQEHGTEDLLNPVVKAVRETDDPTSAPLALAPRPPRRVS